MIAPINYNIDVKDPFESAIQGVQTGMALTNAPAQRQQQQIALQQAAQQKADLFELSQNKNATSSDYAKVMTKYPQISENIKKSWDVLDKGQQQTRLNQATQVYSALNAGKPEIAQQLLTEQATAARNSGDEESAKHADVMAQLIQTSPETAKTSAGLFLAASNPEKFADIHKSLGLDEKVALPPELFKQFTPASIAQYKKTNDPSVLSQRTDLTGDERFKVAGGHLWDIRGDKPIDLTGTSGGKSSEGGDFTEQAGDLLAALADRGISLPAGMRSKAQQIATVNALIRKHPDLTVDEIAEGIGNNQINFGSEKKAATVAAGQEGKVATAVNELSTFGDQALAASAKLPRGSFIPANKLMQMADSSISDPNLLTLKLKLNALNNAYNVLSARGGTDAESRKHVAELFASATGPEGITALVQGLKEEGEGARTSAAKASHVGQPAEQTTPGMNSADRAAIKWAHDNPNDPRAAQINQLHGIQ